MTSSALLTSVAESTVIFLPIVHVGCLSASATVARDTRSGPQVRNGPPEAVRIRRSSSVGRRPATHCSTALCSESTGTISPPPSRAARATSSPAMTSVSLFASATRLPARRAASVASRPAAPTIPFTTIFTSGCVAASTRHAVPFPCPPPPVPPLTSPTKAGSHSAACWASRSLLECPVMATTRNRSRWRASTCSVERPIEPVDPRIAIPTLISPQTRGTTLRPWESRSTENRADRARHRVPGSGWTNP